MIVATLDQKDSRAQPDQVEDWSRDLNDRLAGRLRRPFVRASGDEMQAILGDSAALADVALQSVRRGGWWVGFGVGAVEEPLGTTARDSRGPAFWHAREAVELARERPFGVAVVGEPEAVVADVDAALSLLVSVVSRRSHRAWEVVDRLAEGSTQAEVAAALGVSRQAISQTVGGSARTEEDLGRALVDRLARDVV